MKKTLLIAALLLVGAGCNPPPPATPEDAAVAETAKAVMLLMEDGSELTDGKLTKKHPVGTASCPDPFETISITPDPNTRNRDGLWAASGVPAWLDFPETGVLGEPFTPKFNCDVDDVSPHTEKASITFTFEESEGGVFRIEGGIGMDTAGSEIILETERQKVSLPFDVLVLEIEVELE